MAKLKFEFMHEYYKSHRRPLRDYLFGYFHIAARLLAAFAPLTNWMLGIGWFRNISARIFKITPHRPFPKFSARRARVVHIAGLNTPKIIFLSDAFSRYIEPQVEQAAFDILARCGYEVLVLPIVGAGAALISKSFLDAAKKHAGRVLDALARLDPDCILPLVGVEPPELYAVKNDYSDLLPSRAEEVSRCASRTWLLEEFLLRSSQFDKLRVANIFQQETQNNQSRIKLQSHCHQRAEAPAADGLPTGAVATLSLLRSLGLNAEMIDAGCCGMAGTFGYEAEHYKLSMQVGEMGVLKEIKEWRTDRIPSVFGTFAQSGLEKLEDAKISTVGFGGERKELVCSGAACRMHVAHGTGMEAKHPLEVVAEVLKVGKGEG